VLGDYRRVSGKFALERLRKGDIEGLISSSLGHHLIVFARAASRAAERLETIPQLREASWRRVALNAIGVGGV